LVYTSAYHDLVLDAARADLRGELVEGGLRILAPPRSDGFITQWVGRPIDLRAGDVVNALNGIPISASLTASQLCERVGSEGGFEALVTREGHVRRLRARADRTDRAPEPDIRIGDPKPLSPLEQATLIRRLDALMLEIATGVEQRDGDAVFPRWV